MSVDFEQIADYPTLSDSQRIQAREQAKRNLAARLGGEPRFDDFVHRTHNTFGKGAQRFGFGFAIVVLAAAFSISALHIYSVGHGVYLEGNADGYAAILVGVALVVLAEASMIALSILPTLWDTPLGVTRLMYAGVIASAFIATIGNIDATIFYTSTPFNWISSWWVSLATAPDQWMVATLPPFLTVLVGTGLKYRLLTTSRNRAEARDAYHEALDEWEALLDAIEDHKQWRLFWFNALWDIWRRGKSQQYLSQIDDDTKKSIVLREMSYEAQLERDLNALEFGVNATNAGAFQGKSKKEAVLEWLRSNPEQAERDQTELAATISNATGMQVSQSTVSRAVGAFSKNGHGQTDDKERTP